MKATAYQNGRVLPTASCAGPDCKTVPIPLSRRAPTRVRLEGSGIRHSRSIIDIQVNIDRAPVPVVSFGPAPGLPGRDYLTVELPGEFIAVGETDLWIAVNGAVSNVVRIDLGGGELVELGRRLFYDPRMSVNGTTSCATCHRQELAFTDGRAQARGATGELHPRSSMSLVNMASSRTYTWSDPTVRSLEAQALKPMFGTAPVELGFSSVADAFLRLTRRDPLYRRMFRRAFPGAVDPSTVGNLAGALAEFERTIVSKSAQWDHFHLGDDSAISEAAKCGEILFFLDDGPGCFRCHNGPTFTDGAFHNTALQPGQRARFKTPTLRNVSLTAPYMHDGSIATLGEVVNHYAAGGRARDNPAKDNLMRGFAMTPRNRADLVAFLQSLTDDGLLCRKSLGDPWTSQAR